MRHVIKVVFALAFLVLNVCLIMPMLSRGMSWEEAALGIIPGALVALICFALLLAGVGAKDKTRSRAPRLWAAALVWSVLLGAIVTYVTTSSYQSNMSRAISERTSSTRRSYTSSLEEAYARYDQIGMMYGWAMLGFGGVSLLGLLVSLALRKKTGADLHAQQ